MEWGTSGFWDCGAGDGVEGLASGVVGALDLGPERDVVAAAALLGVRDCPENRVSGEAVRR